MISMLLLELKVGLESLARPLPSEADPSHEPKNPLEPRAAFLFAAIFLAVMVATDLTVHSFGTGALYALAALMGLTDVGPFILSLTQTAGGVTPLAAAAGILIAASSNNVVKGIYAYAFADRKTGIQCLLLLLALAALGLVPLFFL